MGCAAALYEFNWGANNPPRPSTIGSSLKVILQQLGAGASKFEGNCTIDATHDTVMLSTPSPPREKYFISSMISKRSSFSYRGGGGSLEDLGCLCDD
jgi:hypothetical protein